MLSCVVDAYIANVTSIFQQVGPDIPLATIIEEANKPQSSGHSGWKGRAQKIIVMKSKLKEATEALNMLRERLGEPTDFTDGASTVFTRRTVATTRTRLDVDASAKYELQVQKGYLRFHPMAQCVVPVHVLKGLAHADVTENINIFSMGSKFRHPTVLGVLKLLGFGDCDNSVRITGLAPPQDVSPPGRSRRSDSRAAAPVL